MQQKRFYDEGWNARVNEEPFDPSAAKDWRDGWKDCDEATAEHGKQDPV